MAIWMWGRRRYIGTQYVHHLSFRQVYFLALCLAILHMKIVLTLRRLAGNCDHLSKWEFGVVYMSDVLDPMDKSFSKVQSGGKNIMDDTFMFGIFNKISKNVKQFEEYLGYMFEHKKSIPIVSFKNE